MFGVAVFYGGYMHRLEFDVWQDIITVAVVGHFIYARALADAFNLLEMLVCLFDYSFFGD